MQDKISYSSLFQTLSELHDKLKEDRYPALYLEAIKEAQNSILILELLNLARSSKLN